MLLKIHPDNPDPRKVKLAEECLRDGGVIVYPTDTVYSFGCSILKHKAIERIARLKNLKTEKANFSIVCQDLSHLSEYSKAVDNRTYKMMRKAFPGPYTFILNASSQVPRIFKARKKTIGIRIPDNNIARTLVDHLGCPIIASSVHDEDEILEYTTDPGLIHEKYEKLVDLVIDGGFGNLQASTIFDCTGSEPKLIREGIGEIDIF